MRSDDVGEEIISASHSSIELNVSGAVDSYKLSYIFSDVEVFLEARSARFIARCWSRPPRLPRRRTWSRVVESIGCLTQSRRTSVTAALSIL